MSGNKPSKEKREKAFKELNPGEETFYIHKERGITILTAMGSTQNKAYLMRVETEMGNIYYIPFYEYVNLINKYFIYIGNT